MLSCTNVCAQTITDSGANTKKATINDVEFVKVYNVELSWGEMKFSFAEIENYLWDKESHKYYSKISKEWIANGNTVTIHNKSNYSIRANLIYESDSNYRGITGSFTKDNLIIEMNKKENSKLNLSGTLTNNVINYTKIGAITITIF